MTLVVLINKKTSLKISFENDYSILQGLPTSLVGGPNLLKKVLRGPD